MTDPHGRAREEEVRLLLTLARVTLDQGHRDTARELMRSDVDWEALLGLARRHDVVPLVHHHLEALSRSAPVPAEILTGLKREFRANALRNVRLFNALREILDALQGNGIRPIVLKGVSLLGEVYGKQLRSMADVDILIEPGPPFEKAREILLEMGYEAHPTGNGYLRDSDERFRIDVHDELLAPHLSDLGPAYAGLQGRAMPKRIAEVDTLVLGPEDLLRHLTIHAVYGHFFKLKFLVDVHETVLRHGRALQWESLSTWGGGIEVAHFLYPALLLGRRFLDTPVPPLALEQMRLQCPGRLLRHLDGLTPDILISSETSRFVGAGLMFLLTSKSIARSVSYIKEVLLPGTRTTANFHGLSPSSLKAWLLYPSWLAHLVRKDAVAAMRFLRRR